MYFTRFNRWTKRRGTAPNVQTFEAAPYQQEVIAPEISREQIEQAALELRHASEQIALQGDYPGRRTEQPQDPDPSKDTRKHLRLVSTGR